MSSFQRNFNGFWDGWCYLPTGRFVFGNLGWSFENVKDRLICGSHPATIRCTAICAVQGRVLARPFSFAGKREGRGRNAIRATEKKTRQTQDFSALQSRE